MQNPARSHYLRQETPRIAKEVYLSEGESILVNNFQDSTLLSNTAAYLKGTEFGQFFGKVDDMLRCQYGAFSRFLEQVVVLFIYS